MQGPHLCLPEGKRAHLSLPELHGEYLCLAEGKGAHLSLAEGQRPQLKTGGTYVSA